MRELGNRQRIGAAGAIRLLGVLAVTLPLAGCPGGESGSPVEVRPAPGPQRDHEAAYARAWETLEIDRDPEGASAAFAALEADATVPEGLRARSALGRARAERLRGRTEEAEGILREAVRRYDSLPGFRADVRRETGEVAGSRSRYATGILEMREGQFLDLDAGGIFPAPRTPGGGAAELEARAGEAVFLVAAAEDDAGVAAAVPWLCDAPWRRVSTDEGRDAWVQLLPGREIPVVRWVTRLSGTGPVLASPDDPFCVGNGDSVDVHFAPTAPYLRYRVERREGTGGAFEAVATIDGPPYRDATVRGGVRYGYRITGLTEGGDEGIPAAVQGTTRSRGVFSGSCTLRYGSQPTPRPRFDFLGEEVRAEGGDLTLRATYGGGSGAGFLDHLGRVVPSADGGGGDLRTPWAPPAEKASREYVTPGRWVIVPLAGGGVARCRVLMPGDGRDVVLEYEVNPDGDTFPPGPVLETVPSPEGPVVQVVRVPEGFRVDSVRVTDLRGGDGRVLAVADGRAVDAEARQGRVLRYAARGIDRFGRETPEGSTVLNLLPKGVVHGEFRFHYGQGYSLERMTLCGPDKADVVFESCAGGISSITLGASSGITNLESADVRFPRGEAPGPLDLFGAVLSVDPDAVALEARAKGDRRTSESDVFVLRTRHGGWARLAILVRGSEGGWTEHLATVRFSYNPHGPTFSTGESVAEERGGIRLAALDPGARVERARRGDISRFPGAAATEAGRTALELLDGRRVSFNMRGAPLEKVVQALATLGFPVESGPNLDESLRSRRVDLKADAATLREVLESLAIQADIRWTITPEGGVVLDRKEGP